jgi:hypothetical protein
MTLRAELPVQRNNAFKILGATGFSPPSAVILSIGLGVLREEW